MTEKSANQNNTEKCGNNNEQFKTSTQCKIFNRQGFIRNKKKKTTADIETTGTTLTNVFKTTLTEETTSKTKKSLFYCKPRLIRDGLEERTLQK